jgi:nucleoside-diphosphate-sugar epimerase
VTRCYGYVKNVVWQIERVLEAAHPLVEGRVFYVGDPPIILREWVDAFSVGITGRPARVVPTWVLRALGRCGDVVRWLGLPFPIFSSRVDSMTEDYTTPMEQTLKVLGAGPYSLEEGVAETVDWLREQGW